MALWLSEHTFCANYFIASAAIPIDYVLENTHVNIKQSADDRSE